MLQCIEHHLTEHSVDDRTNLCLDEKYVRGARYTLTSRMRHIAETTLSVLAPLSAQLPLQISMLQVQSLSSSVCHGSSLQRPKHYSTLACQSSLPGEAPGVSLPPCSQDCRDLRLHATPISRAIPVQHGPAWLLWLLCASPVAPRLSKPPYLRGLRSSSCNHATYSELIQYLFGLISEINVLTDLLSYR